MYYPLKTNFQQRPITKIFHNNMEFHLFLFPCIVMPLHNLHENGATWNGPIYAYNGSRYHKCIFIVLQIVVFLHFICYHNSVLLILNSLSPLCLHWCLCCVCIHILACTSTSFSHKVVSIVLTLFQLCYSSWILALLFFFPSQSWKKQIMLKTTTNFKKKRHVEFLEANCLPLLAHAWTISTDFSLISVWLIHDLIHTHNFLNMFVSHSLPSGQPQCPSY